MLRTRSVKTVEQQQEQQPCLMFPFFNSPDSAFPELCPEVRNCCGTNKLAAGLFPVAAGTPFWQGRMSVLGSTPPVRHWNACPQPSRLKGILLGHLTTSIREQIEDSTVRCEMPHNTLWVLSFLLGLCPDCHAVSFLAYKYFRRYQRQLGVILHIHHKKVQKTISDKLFHRVQG